MNIPAAIRLINDARRLVQSEEWYDAEARLGEALAALQPQRYVLHNKPGGVDLLYLIDTQHPDYKEGVEPQIMRPWVVLRWTGATEVEAAKARALVELLNTATPHETTT